MNGTLHPITSISLYKLFLVALLLCPTMAIVAGLLHPLRVWASAGEWCQVLATSGKFEVLYGYSQCDRAPVGLVRRFY
ncbi:MAG: hypothetical protein HC771_03045 [Synechococcales cyanobacterium CRU_2_2]|nr:hypothetical protein [Synechococcales cyanobacterium CRU_2_2]